MRVIEAIELIGCHVGRYLAQGMLRIAGHYAHGVVHGLGSGHQLDGFLARR